LPFTKSTAKQYVKLCVRFGFATRSARRFARFRTGVAADAGGTEPPRADRRRPSPLASSRNFGSKSRVVPSFRVTGDAAATRSPSRATAVTRGFEAEHLRPRFLQHVLHHLQTDARFETEPADPSLAGVAVAVMVGGYALAGRMS
jgi:hypothetical protein